MPTLYHAPHSRSSRVISQLLMMGKLDQVEVVCVEVVKNDGTGRRDPRNAHPEGKVPFLITDDGQEIRESAAIMIYLDELFGQPLSPKIGSEGRGEFLSWMAYSGGVLEPALVAHFAGLDHPALMGTFRGMAEVGAQLERGLNGRDFLLGDHVSLADLIMASAFQWAPHLTPDSGVIKSWVARVSAALDAEGLNAFEEEALANLKIRNTA